ncbi:MULTISPECIES: YqgQ family protein [Bhargavaea]|uniref:YqgQ family protein n=1 Tax=Bhargavaea changchunensis TaxID=2134037 RepID=A0ABW2NEG4_9BACL|nr:YqgQ family protein [Bhargavaea sp. CC-171006]
METVYDVMQLLKRFGTFVYTGDRNADLILMEMEVRQLYDNGLITQQQFIQSRLILRKGK